MVNHELPDEPLPALTPQGASRRRMAGLGVSGVLMTVASSNTMAQMVCRSPSGALSDTNASHSPGQTCDGRSPEWWLANEDQFPSGMTLDDKFGKVFPAHPSMRNKSIRKVLQQRGTGHDEIAALLMATYLNVNSRPKRISFLTSQAVLEMWRKWENDKEFRPTEGGEAWGKAEFANYLKQTQVM